VRAPSKRSLWDATITEVLASYYEPDEHGRRKPESLYGSLKMWAHLQREGVPVAKSTVERLMRRRSWQGVRRQKSVRTRSPTRPRCARRISSTASSGWARRIGCSSPTSAMSNPRVSRDRCARWSPAVGATPLQIHTQPDPDHFCETCGGPSELISQTITPCDGNETMAREVSPSTPRCADPWCRSRRPRHLETRMSAGSEPVGRYR
jgi:hypothetical protein